MLTLGGSGGVLHALFTDPRMGREQCAGDLDPLQSRLDPRRSCVVARPALRPLYALCDVAEVVLLVGACVAVTAFVRLLLRLPHFHPNLCRLFAALACVMHALALMRLVLIVAVWREGCYVCEFISDLPEPTTASK